MTRSDHSSSEGRLLQEPPLRFGVDPWASWGIALLALGASCTGLANGFAFDDLSIIVQDPRLHRIEYPWRFFAQTYWGPPASPTLYRPLTSVAFALQWDLGGGSPWLYHLINVLLYVITCLAVHRLARGILGPVGGWWTAALFAVHPVHVEAVANAVGQSELWAALTVVLAAAHYLEARRRSFAASDVVMLTLLYAAACLFKEHALVLPALLLATEVALPGGSVAPAARERNLRRLWVSLTAVAVGYWIVHILVTGSFAGGRPSFIFWGMSISDRWLTMLGVVPEWFRLLFLPVRLSVDYMPQEILRATTLGWPQIEGIGQVLLLAGAAWSLRHSLPVFTFAALWIGISLLPVSNVLLPTGVLLAERTLFLPSVGACLMLGAVIAWLGVRSAGWTPGRRRLLAALGVAVVAAGTIRSAARQPVWRNNQALFDQQLIDAPLSYRAHWVRAFRRYDARDDVGGDRELATAIALFPDDPGLLAQMADRYRATGRCDEAVPLYRHSLEIDRRRHYLRRRVIDCLARGGRFDEAREEVARALVAREPSARQDSARLDSLLSRP